jgi:DNA-binding transcriptional LysR family regulator
MNQYDLVSLQLFMATVDQGNIAAAARSNNIAASAVGFVALTLAV